VHVFPQGSFVKNRKFFRPGFGALLRCELLVWLATRRISRLALHRNPARKKSGSFPYEPLVDQMGCVRCFILEAVPNDEGIFQAIEKGLHDT
jgi:hypothetical protein